MQNLYGNARKAVALNTQAIATNTTVNGAIIDLAGTRETLFSIQAGTLTDGTYTPSLTEGDAANLSDGTTVAAGDLVGTIAGATFAATEDNTVKVLGYRGNKRYLRLNITTTGITTGGTIGAQVTQVAHQGPVR